MHEVVSDAPGAGARRKFACRHLRQTKSALVQQFLWHDDDLVPRQRRAHDRVRTRDIVDETVSGHNANASPVLLEIRASMRLKQNFYVGMLARTLSRLCDAMLARLDLTQFQTG